MIQEDTAISWCLQNPEEFWMLSEQFHPKQFHNPPWDILWPVLLKGFREHNRWPDPSEFPTLVNRLDLEAATKMVAAERLRDALATPVSSYTKADITRWLSLQKFRSIGEELLNASESRHSIQEIIDHQKAALEEIERISAGVKPLGQRYSPMDDPDGWADSLEDDYGGKPQPTGFYRLDSILRDGGVRPTLVLIVGPSGGGKTTVLLAIEAFCVRNGGRVLHYHNDDSQGDMRNRWYSRVIQRPITMDDRKDPERKRVISEQLRQRYATDYQGRWEGVPLEPDQDTPKAIIADIKRLKREFIAEDRAWCLRTGNHIPEEELGEISAIGVDAGQQVKPERPIQGRSELEMEKMFVALSYVPKIFHCPLYLTVQGGQQTVGATQITMRDLSGSYGQAKPAKLILGVAQTVAQSQGQVTVDTASEFYTANKHHLWDYNEQLDRNVEWQPLSLCVIKNTMAEGRSGLVKNVIFPMLADFSTCRIIEDFSSARQLMRSSHRTLMEEREAQEGEKGKPPRQHPNSSKKGNKI